MCGIGIDSWMPDHQVLEAGYLARRLQHPDFAIFGFQSCESPGRRKNQFSSRNTPRSRSEIWQGNHGATAVAVRSETLLRYMLRTFHDIDADVLGREVLFQRELALVGRIRRHNTDEFFFIDHLSQ